METETEEEALIILGRTKAGKRIAKVIERAGTTIEFGETEKNAAAQYDPENNIITISDEYKNASAEYLATLLAHEGVHVLYRESDKFYFSHVEYKAWETEAKTAKELGVDSYAIKVIYDEDGKKRTEKEVIDILEDKEWFDPPYVFPDRP